MTKLLQRLHEELVRRNYATTTRKSYLRIVHAFRRHTGRRLDYAQIRRHWSGPDDLPALSRGDAGKDLGGEHTC